MEPLPDFVPPMLAVLRPRAFDSDEHLFEIKWDGIRALSFVEGDAPRVLTRNANAIGDRYPELDALRALPAGTVLDGELVVLVDERPEFQASLKRVQARDARRVATLARSSPALYVVFDLLYEGGERIVDRPLTERRERLTALLDAHGEAPLMLSEGIVGPGAAFFEQARERELEGVVAKRLDGAYLPGQRSESWTKIKTTREVHCLVLGWIPDGRDVKSLVVATDRDGALTVAGRVGSGLDEATRRDLAERLTTIEVDAPLIPCPEREARWVAPELYCTVRFLEWTRDGHLRAPVFLGLVDG